MLLPQSIQRRRSSSVNFTQQQIDELIRLGWAPQYDERMQIIGFDKWVKAGDPVIVPHGAGILVRHDQVTWEIGIVLKKRKYEVLPKKAVRFA